MILKNTNREYKIFNQPFFQYGNSKKIKLRDSFISIANGKYGDEISEKSENIVNVYTLNHFSKNSKAGLIKRDIPLNQLKNKILDYGDIVIERSGGGVNHFVGRSFMFDIQTDEIYTSVDFTRIIKLKKEDFDPKYMNFLLKFLNRNEIMEKFAQKTTKISNLKSSFFDIELHFPTIEQQIKIRNILNNHEEQITRIQSLLEKIEIRNKYYADKLLSGELTIENNLLVTNNNNKKNQTIKITDHIDIINGYPFKSNEMKNEGKYAVIKMSNFKESKVSTLKNTVYTDNLVNKAQLMKNDLLIGLSGSVGEFAIFNLNEICLLNQRCIILRNKNDDIGDYVKTYIINKVLEVLKNSSEGGVIKNVSSNFFQDMEMILPLEYKEIMLFINKTNEEKEKVEKLLKLEEQRFKWLSDKLLSGEYIIED